MKSIIEKINKFQQELSYFKDFSSVELSENSAFGDLVWVYIWNFITNTPELHSQLTSRVEYFDRLFNDKDFATLEADIEAIVDDWFNYIDYNTVVLVEKSEDFGNIVRFYGARAFKTYAVDEDFGFCGYKNLYKTLQNTKYFDKHWAEYSPVFEFLENTKAMFEQLSEKYDFLFSDIQLYQDKMKEFEEKTKELFELCTFKPQSMAVFEFTKYTSICSYKRGLGLETEFQLEKCEEFLVNPHNYKELYRITAKVLGELKSFCENSPKLQLKLFVAEQRAVFDNKELDLKGIAFETLLVMAKAPERYHTIDELYPLQSTDRGQVVRTIIKRIRQSTTPDFVKNKVQIGYKLALSANEIAIF